MIEQPDPKKNIFTLKYNNVNYEINLINEKIYQHELNSYALGFMMICIVCLIILVLYDKVKDIISWISGAKDLSNNNASGMFKMYGWTKDNMIRTILMFVLAGLIIFSGFFLKLTKELNYIPEVLNSEWEKFIEKKAQEGETVFSLSYYMGFY